jgi:hypothetical protein
MGWVQRRSSCTPRHPPGSTVEPIKAHTIRQVRLRVPDPLYRTLRHRLADCGPETSISDLVVELIEKGPRSGDIAALTAIAEAGLPHAGTGLDGQPTWGGSLPLDHLTPDFEDLLAGLDEEFDVPRAEEPRRIWPHGYSVRVGCRSHVGRRWRRCSGSTGRWIPKGLDGLQPR